MLLEKFEGDFDETTSDMVSQIVAKTIIDVGPALLEQVNTRIHKNFNSDISECFEHPQYLNSALKDLFGDSFLGIVQTIKLRVEGLGLDDTKEFVSMLGV
ncbi:hypothetical protein [Nitrosopumilus sp. Nsub]|uniref:hypothetical protein n=1 Tax=Nitrosopumilus sp. Nsub TaxID=1776294 RepID=UPI0008364E93|nr:hypothetical protein [Nitrosopumilus sp. Nsub]MBS1268721.1 hypothetical protein [Nitrosopumilus sp.]